MFPASVTSHSFVAITSESVSAGTAAKTTSAAFWPLNAVLEGLCIAFLISPFLEN